MLPASLSLFALATLPFAAQATPQAEFTQTTRTDLAPLSSVAVVAVSVPNLPAVFAEDIEREASDLPPRYAIPYAVSITPNTHGTWENLDATTLLWRLRIQAPLALSINLGFSNYRMPAGGELHLYSADRTQFVRPFTAADNEEHGELWSPIIATEELVLELVVPMAQVGNIGLTLTQIGYGYRGFGTSKGSGARSGSCNVDVICPQGDNWRLDIPSVGVISTGGGTFCTGFLVNNVRADHKPYFMTAFHCGIRAGNAPSLVVYWNFENSTCRTPGSGQSGQNGNGVLNMFNSGATFRSGSSNSDFTLVELDDDPDPNFQVSFAGWSNSSADATRAIAIHHPSTDEKRISFENDPTTTTTYLSNSVPGNGTHVRVIDWDLGTTEPGSSGSPLFDQNHRIIGQLHGGFASCSSQTSDWYGRFSVSWNGSSSSTRLRDWLDPDNTGTVTVDTISSQGTRGVSGRYGSEIGGANIGALNGTVPTIGLPLTLDVAGFVNSSLAIIQLSAAKLGVPALGGAILIDLSAPIGLLTTGLSGGVGSATSNVPNDMGLVGTTIYAQAGAIDATQSAGFAFSNGLSIFFGDF